MDDSKQNYFSATADVRIYTKETNKNHVMKKKHEEFVDVLVCPFAFDEFTWAQKKNHAMQRREK